MYTFDSRVRYSETDADAHLTIESIIDYMQDCTNFQSEDLGVGLEYHRERQIMWVLMDLKKGRPMIVTPEIGDVYGIHEPLQMDYASRKIRVPQQDGETLPGYVVQEYHLDANHHVNNGQYVRMALAAIKEEITVRELRVEYRKQAVLGDEMVPVVYRMDSEYLVTLNGADGKPYAVVQLFIR